jgi:hypothetical protein
MRKKNKILPFKKISKFELPSDNDKLEDFIKKNKNKMVLHSIKMLEYAVRTNLEFVEIFRFKNSNFIVTISKEEYKENVEFIFEQLLKDENYEFCDFTIKLKDKIYEKK